MRAYRVSKECNDSIDEKFSMIKSYDVGDLLYVLRDIEENPGKYDESVIKGGSRQALRYGDYVHLI